MRGFSFLILLIALQACNSNNKWQTISAKGLPENTFLTCITFADNNVGYAASGIMSPLSVFKTNNGGETWIPLSAINTGNKTTSIHKLFSFRDTLLALTSSIGIAEEFILQYNNGKWNTVLSCKKDEDIDAAFFNNSQHGYVIISETGSTRDPILFKINNSKRDTLATIPYGYSNYVFTKDTVYCISNYLGNKENTTILATSLHTGISNITDLNTYNITYCTVDNNYGLLYATEHNDSTTIWRERKGRTEKIILGEYANYTPSQLFANNDFIISIASRKEDSSIIGVTHIALVSTNNGKTWKKEELPESLSTKPAYLFNNNKFISFGLLNIFQIRN